MAIKKVPAFPAIFIGALIGAIWGYIFQPDLLASIAGGNGFVEKVAVVWKPGRAAS